MKKLKCRKCELYFKDRDDPGDKEAYRTLCHNCRHICSIIDMTVLALNQADYLNRKVILDSEDVFIAKIVKTLKPDPTT